MRGRILCWDHHVDTNEIFLFVSRTYRLSQEKYWPYSLHHWNNWYWLNWPELLLGRASFYISQFLFRFVDNYPDSIDECLEHTDLVLAWLSCYHMQSIFVQQTVWIRVFKEEAPVLNCWYLIRDTLQEQWIMFWCRCR